MGSRQWKQKLVTAGLMSLMVVPGVAFGAEGNWYDSVAIGGHVQGSYVANLSKDIPRNNELRVYDNNPGFNLNQAQIRIAKPLGDDGYGFAIKLMTGKDAGSIHSNGLGTDSSFDLEEAYVTLGVPRVKGLSFTGGKFVTSCGVEVIESPLNMMISPGYLFFFGMPFTHTGAKLAYAVNDKITVMGGLANGWDQTTDINPGKTVIWQLATSPLKAMTANLSGSYGPELFGTTNAPASGNLNVSKRTHLDLVLGYTGIDKVTLNAEALWGQDSNVGGAEDTATATWTGYGLWAGYALSDLINPGVRFEIFKDDTNEGAATGRLSSGAFAGDQTAKTLTVNNKFVTSKNTFMRVEFRHDWSTEAAYRRDNGGGVTNQNTISADWVVTF